MSSHQMLGTTDDLYTPVSHTQLSSSAHTDAGSQFILNQHQPIVLLDCANQL